MPGKGEIREEGVAYHNEVFGHNKKISWPNKKEFREVDTGRNDGE